MKQPPRTGMTGERAIAVGPDNRVSFADGRMPAVLATPWLVAYLEQAARRDRPVPGTARAMRRNVHRARTPGPCSGRVHRELPRPRHPR